MYNIERTTGFKKAFKRCVKRGLNIEKFETVIKILSECGSLPEEYHPHKLSSRFNYAWECHISPDWLLIWQQDDEKLILLLVNTGTHSDIFG
ncbi:MAG: type II toxin-antitoxin system YafQ family toxin [Muribaculaceae bacterium]|nr:type II toxin-antitoxin system YafQ family toxin [Muribaculaceae bacterium]